MADPIDSNTGALAVASPPPAPVSPQETAPPAPAGNLPAEPVAAAPAPVVPEPAAPAPAPAPEEPVDKPSLLETFDKDGKAKSDPAKTAEVKPETEKPKADAKPEEAKPADAAPAVEPPAPTAADYKFELPEVLKADDAKLTAFREVLAEGKLGADIGSEVGQKLLTMHADAMKDYDAHLRSEQRRVFNDTRADWNKQVLADPEIGGSGHQTAMRAIARARDVLVSSEKPGTPAYQKDMNELEHFMRITGAGDHPAFLKMLHRAARWIDEPQAAQIPTNIRPTPNNGRAPGSFKEALYDNPRSNPTGR